MSLIRAGHGPACPPDFRVSGRRRRAYATLGHRLDASYSALQLRQNFSPLIRSFLKAFQQLDNLAIEPWIEHPKGCFDKAFINKIPFDVSLNYWIEVALIPAQGAGCMINMNRARQMISDRIFFLHGSVAAPGSKICAG